MMKIKTFWIKGLLCAFFLCGVTLFTSPLLAQSGKTTRVSLNKMPSSLKEFKTQYNKMATTPEGAIIMFVAAMDIYSRNIELGELCMGWCFHPEERNGDKPDRNFMSLIVTRFHQGNPQPWLALSYFNGAKPENGYRPSVPYSMNIRNRGDKSGYLSDLEAVVEQRFVKSFGADNERPVKVLRVEGERLFYMFGYGSIVTKVRKPKKGTFSR